jgi:hypothetical protein
VSTAVHPGGCFCCFISGIYRVYCSVTCCGDTESKISVFLLSGLAMGENTCSPMCTMEYNPVCAGDGVSEPVIFENPCGLKYHNCVNPDKSKSCNILCTKRTLSKEFHSHVWSPERISGVISYR